MSTITVKTGAKQYNKFVTFFQRRFTHDKSIK